MVKLPKRVTACILIEPNYLCFQSLLRLMSGADFLLYGRCVIRTPTMLFILSRKSLFFAYELVQSSF